MRRLSAPVALKAWMLMTMTLIPHRRKALQMVELFGVIGEKTGLFAVVFREMPCGDLQGFQNALRMAMLGTPR